MMPAPAIATTLLTLMLTLAGIAPVAVAATTLPPGPSMRLSTAVRPLAAEVALQVDPATPQHSGQVRITLELQHAQRTLALHARELKVTSAVIDLGVRQLPARVRRLDAERIELRFAAPVPQGRAQLRLDFRGELQSREPYGLFRRQHDGHWYAATQFEPTGARLAFPLLDEPGWKLPWTLTLTVPQGLTAVANTPVRAQSEARAGWQRFEFEPTAPLPSYLLAFGIGPWDVLDAPPAGALPVRFITPRGRAADAAWAAGVTARIVGDLEAYFDLPHPYTKLDNLALPVHEGFGAMENAGLVTYAAPLVLAAPGEATPSWRRGYVSLAAHELAHQWFGNLVTMRWWDDLWLNESFASWLGDRITAGFDPGWQLDTAVQQARQRAMDADQRPSARRVREPVLSNDDFGHLWDPITYEKGQVLLAMSEQWMGADRMREAMRRYIRRHAWGHADVDDMLRALGEADADVPGMLRSYIHRTGVPQVQVSVQCDDDAPRLRVRQSAWRSLAPGGPRADATDPLAAQWQIPLQVRTPGGLTRFMLRAGQDEVPLPDTTCPAWVQANAGGGGYYRSVYSPALQQALWQRPQPEVAELLTDLDDALALSQSGGVPAAALLELVQRNADHADRRVVEAAARLLKRLRPVLQPSDGTAYARAWQAAFGLRARKLGWQAAAHDSVDDRLLRQLLVPAVADLGADVDLQGQALALAQRWLAGGPAPESDIRAPMVAMAALATPDPALSLYDQMTERAARALDTSEQSAWLGAAMRLRAPELKQRALSALLLPATDLTVALPALLDGAAHTEEGRSAALRFIATHRAALAARSGRDAAAGWPWYFSGACSMGEARLIEATFAPLAARAQGGARQLTQVLDGVRLCAAWRQAQSLN
jgi:alanyl aminopeptidase